MIDATEAPGNASRSITETQASVFTMHEWRTSGDLRRLRHEVHP